MNAPRKASHHTQYWAFLAHRVSGLLLAVFLPLHFWALGQALHGAAALDEFLVWTDNPLAKLAELGLAFLLAVHLTGGLRLLALEFLAWRDWQKTAVALSGGVSVFVALAFLLRAF